MAEDDLVIDFWDVGQADCTVIQTPKNGLIIIDVGTKTSPLVDWLARSSHCVHAIILTHNDADHAGSLTSIMSACRGRIGTVFMLEDRSRRDPNFQMLFSAVYAAENSRDICVERLDRGRVIWRDGTRQLKAVFPSFTANISAKLPNNTSGIVCLDVDGNTIAVWPGDSPFARIVENCAPNPPLLAGPHHGAPIDKGSPAFANQVRKYIPKEVFISVGTSNSLTHPHGGYLRSLREVGARVYCSEMTVQCDRKAVLKSKSVLDGAALLGLPSLGNGTSCRGTRRVRIRGIKVLGSQWDSIHQKRILSLHRPLCRKGKPPQNSLISSHLTQAVKPA